MGFIHLPLHTSIFLGGLALLTIIFHLKYNEKTIAYGSTILTTTGIFATFVGIALGLADFDTAHIEASVPALLDGLKTAFWGSVAGVGGALTLKFRYFFIPPKQHIANNRLNKDITAYDLAVLLQNIQNSLVGKDESTLVSQLKLLRQDNNDRLDSLKKAQEESLQKMSEMGSKTLIEALKDVIRDFNEKLTEQFGENFKELNKAVGKILLWQAEYKNHIDKSIEVQKATTILMKSAADNYQKLVNESEHFTKTASDLSNILQALESQKNQINVALKSLADLLVAASGSLPEIENKIIELTHQLKKTVEVNQLETNRALIESKNLIKLTINEVSKDLNEINQDLNNNINKMSTQLRTTLEDNQLLLNKTLMENKSLIKTTIQETGLALNKLNGDFNKHVGEMTEKTNKQITALDAALSEELRKSLESLGRQLASLSEKFVSDYTPLTEKLKDIVNISRRL